MGVNIYTIIYIIENRKRKVNRVWYKFNTLSFRCGICPILVQEGPLFDTNTSHVLAGRLKWAAHAFFKFTKERSSYSKLTNSLGWTGLNVCLVSGSDASLCTMIS